MVFQIFSLDSSSRLSYIIHMFKPDATYIFSHFALIFHFNGVKTSKFLKFLYGMVFN